jgi:hypothetical protein
VLAPFRGPRTQLATDGSVVPPLFPDDVAPILLAERRHKYVKRLSLLFDDEDATLFFQRLQLAQVTRQAALAQRRLHAFVQSFRAQDHYAPMSTPTVHALGMLVVVVRCADDKSKPSFIYVRTIILNVWVCCDLFWGKTCGTQRRTCTHFLFSLSH